MAAGPMRIRASVSGDEINVRVLMSHPMETGQRKDPSGNVIPAHYITEVVATINDKIVLTAEWGPAVSTNPYFEFNAKGKAGDTVKVKWVDNKGESREDSVQVK
jgi:sulfur-oxidizing protein SoxZ